MSDRSMNPDIELPVALPLRNEAEVEFELTQIDDWQCRLLAVQ